MVAKTFYITEYSDHKDMLIACIKSLMQRKYHTYKVYLHNFSNFDGIFLFNILIELSSDIKPIINDGKFINITFKYNNSKYNLYFRDSFLMLPLSLRKLAKSFNVEEKSIFPYRFVNIAYVYNNYVGDVPPFEYFDDLNLDQYKDYVTHIKNSGKEWNLREETIKYCIQDCVTLYQVLDSFFKENFENSRVNPSKYVSLPSLSLANFRTNFIKDDCKNHIIRGEVYNFIKNAYTGGLLMFINH